MAYKNPSTLVIEFQTKLSMSKQPEKPCGAWLFKLVVILRQANPFPRDSEIKQYSQLPGFLSPLPENSKDMDFKWKLCKGHKSHWNFNF